MANPAENERIALVGRLTGIPHQVTKDICITRLGRFLLCLAGYEVKLQLENLAGS
jgi:hypothetical protein